MKCAVCGGRGTDSTDFVMLWKITDKGEKVGGKPVYAHVGCSHKMIGYMEATIAKKSLSKRLQKIAEKATDRLNFIKKLPKIIRKEGKNPAYSPKTAKMIESQATSQSRTERQERRKQERDSAKAEKKARGGVR
jgi:hypothetical protein